MARISIITAAYNSEHTLERALESGLAQSWRDFELIAVNDGSTDGTAAILARYGDRIRVVNRERGGCSVAWNTGIRAARGEFIAFLDADDEWLPDKLARTLPILEGDPTCTLVFSNGLMFEPGGAVRGPFVLAGRDHAPTLDEMLAHWWPIVPSLAVIRRAAYEEVGGFFEAPGVFKACEDVYMWLRLRELGHFSYVPEILVRYRILPYPDYIETNNEGRRALGEMVIARYGVRGRRLMRSIEEDNRRAHVNQLSHRGLVAMREGRSAEARRDLIRALGYEPFNLKNALRMMRTFLPAPIAKALTGRTRKA
ncbi:MAG TPA: glycosyltransferase [Candidatus Binataceae bacterium]|nr:glycosyltransferase [Candidatus Binataceae bacterium]